MGNARTDVSATAQPIGFVPRFPPPPKYARVKAHYKKERTFNRLFQAQELESLDSPAPANEDERTGTAGTQSSKTTGKAIWALMFSKDGKYLAAAGQDRKVRVWAVIASPEDRESSESEGEDDERLKAPVFKQTPVQVYDNHAGSILDLSWSKVCQSEFIFLYKLTDLRTTSYSPRLWTKLSGCGMYPGRNVCVASSTAIS